MNSRSSSFSQPCSFAIANSRLAWASEMGLSALAGLALGVSAGGCCWSLSCFWRAVCCSGVQADGEEAHWLRRGDGDLDDQPAGVDTLRCVDSTIDAQPEGGLRTLTGEGPAREQRAEPVAETVVDGAAQRVAVGFEDELCALLERQPAQQAHQATHVDRLRVGVLAERQGVEHGEMQAIAADWVDRGGE